MRPKPAEAVLTVRSRRPGRVSLSRSQRRRPAGVVRYQRSPASTASTATSTAHQKLRRKLLMEMSSTVGRGRACWVPSNTEVMLGTMKVISRNSTTTPTRAMNSG